MLAQDIRTGKGFLCIDLHGDLTPFVLSQVAAEERRTSADLGGRIINIDPASRTHSVGLNVLDTDSRMLPVLLSEVVAMFRDRWSLDHFGARTEELLCNCLWVLAEQALALTDLTRLLTDLVFRAELVQRTSNPDVKDYFRTRYEQLSDAMQAVMREPILNKLTAFTVDPAIRHIVGQRRSTVDLLSAMDKGNWIVLRVHKGQLGGNAGLLAGLILAKTKSAVFSRKTRTLFTIYADELQSLLTPAETFETLLAEARKFGCSIATANQHLAQYSPRVRAALLAAGTNIFFRSSPEDVPRISAALGGGKNIEQLIKDLPDRHFLVRSSSTKAVELISPSVAQAKINTEALLTRSNRIWARPRGEIENEIRGDRQPTKSPRKEALEEWK